MSFLMKIVIGGKIDKRILEYYFKIYTRSTGFEADFMLQEMVINGVPLKFQNWVLYTYKRSVLFYGGLALIIFYHKNDRTSYKEVVKWYNNFKKYSGRSIEEYPQDCLVIVAMSNNSEKVTIKEGQVLADKLGMVYFETSLQNKAYLEDLPKIVFKIGEAFLEYIRIQQAK